MAEEDLGRRSLEAVCQSDPFNVNTLKPHHLEADWQQTCCSFFFVYTAACFTAITCLRQLRQDMLSHEHCGISRILFCQFSYKVIQLPPSLSPIFILSPPRRGSPDGREDSWSGGALSLHPTYPARSQHLGIY